MKIRFLLTSLPSFFNISDVNCQRAYPSRLEQWFDQKCCGRKAVWQRKSVDNGERVLDLQNPWLCILRPPLELQLSGLAEDTSIFWEIVIVIPDLQG